MKKHVEFCEHLRKNGKEYSNKMAPADEIWRVAEEAWREMESSTIARGFVLAYWLAEKVIKHKGTNEFLRGGDFHCSVPDHFINTDTGIKKKTLVLN